MQDFKPDLTTTTASKMLLAVFVMLKIEPSLAGIIKATGNDPEKVFKLITEATDKAPEMMGQVEELLLRFREMNAQQARIEAKLDRQAMIQVSVNDMLCALCEKAGVEHTGYLPAPRFAIEDAQLVTQAALDEASGRS
jgi:hypothetical protein